MANGQLTIVIGSSCWLKLLANSGTGRFNQHNYTHIWAFLEIGHPQIIQSSFIILSSKLRRRIVGPTLYMTQNSKTHSFMGNFGVFYGDYLLPGPGIGAGEDPALGPEVSQRHLARHRWKSQGRSRKARIYRDLSWFPDIFRVKHGWLVQHYHDL